MKKGLTVKLVNCLEAEMYKEPFETTSDSWAIGGIGDKKPRLIELVGTKTGKYFPCFSVACLRELKQPTNIKNLLELIKKNPGLEILPRVNTEVIGSDDHAWWLGSFGKARIDEIWNDGEDIYIRSEDEDDLIDDYIESRDDDKNWHNGRWVMLTDAEKEQIAKEEIEKNYDWKKCILVWISTPE